MWATQEAGQPPPQKHERSLSEGLSLQHSLSEAWVWGLLVEAVAGNKLDLFEAASVIHPSIRFRALVTV